MLMRNKTFIIAPPLRSMVIADYCYPEWGCLLDFFLQPWVENVLARLRIWTQATLDLNSRSQVPIMASQPRLTLIYPPNFMLRYKILHSTTSTFTACYYHPDWGCLVDFCSIWGWKVAVMVKDLNPQPEIKVRCLWPLSQGKPQVNQDTSTMSAYIVSAVNNL